METDISNEYDKYCQSNELNIGIHNFHNMHSMLDPYDEYRTILQAQWIRDKIGIHRFVKNILCKNFKFNINYLQWNVSDIYPSSKTIDENNNEKKLQFQNKIKNAVNKLESDKIYFICLLLPEHVNLIYVDTYQSNQSKFVYIYEPHVPTEQELENGEY
jgi:hypothetical protein